jgi:gas vesicle protein
MSRNTTQADQSAEEVSHNIAGVAQAADDTAKGAGQSLRAAKELSKMSGRLRELVSQFRVEAQSQSARKTWQAPVSVGREFEQPEPVEELVGTP